MHFDTVRLIVIRYELFRHLDETFEKVIQGLELRKWNRWADNIYDNFLRSNSCLWVAYKLLPN